MARSLPNLVNNLAERILKVKCKYGNGNKKFKTYEIKCKGCKYCFEYTNVKDDLVVFECLCCNKNYQKKFDENLKK